MRFVHDSLPQRVCFGAGLAREHLKTEVEKLGATRVMVIASKRDTELVGVITQDIPVARRHDEVVMHVPVEVAARARAAAQDAGADALVSIGGGSTTGLAKAIPHWVGGSMGETDVRQDGHLMRDFNFSFSIRLNDGENQDR